MCFGGSTPPKDNSAEIARREELARQTKIKAGQGEIESRFASAFDPGYYDKYATDYTNAYVPDLEGQYQNARKKLTLNLARTGNLTSSEGAGRLSELLGAFGKEKAGITDRALNAANDLRGRVDQTKSSLYDFNRQALDPAQTASRAEASLAGLQGPPQYSPLGSVFADFLQSANTGLALESKGYPGYRTGLFTPQSSARLVA
jgi:hypothetical protein